MPVLTWVLIYWQGILPGDALSGGDRDRLTAACSTSGGMMTDVKRRRVDKEAVAVRGRGGPGSGGAAVNGGAGEGQGLSAAGLAQGLVELPALITS